MGATPDQLKSEIDRTRGELAANVDGLSERVSPSRIAKRRTASARSAVTSVRDRVMGQMGQAPEAARARTEGNPIAAGLIAFGAGMLAAALIPTTPQEEKLGSTVKEAAREVGQPIAESAKSMAQDMADELQPQAQQAVQDVKDRAGEATRATAEHAKSAAGNVRENAKDTKDAMGNVRR